MGRLPQKKSVAKSPFVKAVVLALLFSSTIKAQPAVAPALGLSAAVAEALAKSPQIRRAGEELRIAELEEPSVLANTDPTLAASAALSNDRGPRSSPSLQGSFTDARALDLTVTQKWLTGTSAQTFFKTLRTNNPALFRPLNPTVDSRVGLEVKQPLLRHFWGRPDKAARRKARALVRAAEGRMKRAQEEAAAKAAFAYINAFLASGSIGIREAAAADARRLVEKFREKKRYGLVEESDLLQAMASLRVRESELRSARSHLAQARYALASALYRTSSSSLGEFALPPLPNKNLPDQEAALAQALAQRSDLQASRSLIEREEWSLRAETLATIPELAAFGSYASAGLDRTTSPSLRDAFSLDHRIITGGLEFSITFGRKREGIRREEARRRLELAKADVETLENQVRQGVADALDRLALALELRGATRELLDLERRKLAAAEEDFRGGRTTTDLLIRFQGDIHRAQIEALKAETDALAGWAELGLATGGLLDVLSELGARP